MSKQFYILWLCVIAVFTLSCSDDEGLQDPQISAPFNVDAKVTLTQDNSGDVTFLPTGENANAFFIDYGDGSSLSDTIAVGQSFSHTYEEGNYDVTLFATNVSGSVSEVVKPLEVSFNPPENLEVSITKDPNDPLTVIVSATADNAAGFKVTFGENPDETPQDLGVSESINYTYASVGDFEITVTALSGGEATTSISETITVTDPFVFPVDFESSTVDYTFFNFGGGEGDGIPIVDNPDPNAVNDSQSVASYTKVSGSETWAGTSATLNDPIDFSDGRLIKMDVYSPEAGVPVLFKIENAEDNTIFVESIVNTTVANEWETLTFDMSSADLGTDYSVIAIFFNFETSGTGETYYFDNLRTASAITLNLPLGFEQPVENYQFGEFGGGTSEVIPNPDQSGINTSAQVAKQNKASGSQTWAGTSIDLTEKVDFNISTTLTMKVWSPEADIPILLKFEDPNDSNTFVEITSNVTEANTWTEVEFDFSGVDATQDWRRMAVFFDFGTAGTGLDYYFDDITYSTEASDDLVGTWKMAEEAGSLGVGPSVGDISWFSCDAGCVADRTCYFNDTYTFNSDGTFTNGFGNDNQTWVEEWQSGSPDACAAPVAPHDGSNAATYSFDAQNNTLTLSGEGAFIGLPKAVNAGELPGVDIPSEVTYTVALESPTSMSVYVESGDGVFWQYKLVKQ
ncbi:MAG: hypothetical protein R6V36_11190 [Psychroflexus sp.]